MATRLDAAMSQAEDATAAIYRNFQNSAGCSVEQIFTPLSIFKNGNSPTPGFRPNVSLQNDRGLFSQQSVGPTIRELNPYFPLGIVAGDTDGSLFFQNCDYNAVVMEPATDLSRAKTDLAAVQAVRTKGLRAPVILSGWGFDLCDTPVPYMTQGEKRAFDSRLVNDRRYWKTGPLHVMWDEERQVWSGGPQIVVGTATTPSSNGNLESPEAFVVSLKRAGNSPETLTEYGESVVCKNRDPELVINTGQWVVCARINYEWIAIQAGGGGTSIRIGAFNGVWGKGSSKSVTQTIPPPNGNQGPVSVINLFAKVGESGGSNQNCAYASIDSSYYLIAAECTDDDDSSGSSSESSSESSSGSDTAGINFGSPS